MPKGEKKPSNIIQHLYDHKTAALCKDNKDTVEQVALLQSLMVFTLG